MMVVVAAVVLNKVLEIERADKTRANFVDRRPMAAVTRTNIVPMGMDERMLVQLE